MPHDIPEQFTNVAELYDDLMSVVPYPWWVQYVERLWWGFSLKPRRVLDLACGTGNVLRELLSRGYEAAGADSSGAMIEVARRKFPPEVPLWCEDARYLDLDVPPFDACVCLFDSLNYITTLPDLEKAFRAVRRHLVPGGSFIFDMNAIRALETGMFDQKGTGRDASLEYAWESAWDPISRLCTIQMEFRSYERAGTRVFHETHVQKGYTLREVTRLLDLASFEVLAVYDAFSTRPPNPKTDRFYVVARAIGA
jgi:SAM-dependent methyltransferase